MTTSSPRPSLPRRCVAEAFATFALVFAGCGAIVANAERGGIGSNGVAVAFGLVIMVMVYATGHVSGAHINPAVTIAFALSRHFPARDTLAYVPSQLAGAIAGALLLRATPRAGPSPTGRELGLRLTGSLPTAASPHRSPWVHVDEPSRLHQRA